MRAIDLVSDDPLTVETLYADGIVALSGDKGPVLLELGDDGVVYPYYISGFDMKFRLERNLC
ncbi:MAG: hypothetical protein KTR25_03235 [Myxococcales bacterium]|nr:hypothetical protein [Myxococcales bacterium]